MGAMDRCHRIGQTRPVAVYRLLTIGSVDIEMMEKQISKKKLERMAIVGGDFRKAGLRSRKEVSSSVLRNLLSDDIKDLQQRCMINTTFNNASTNQPVEDISLEEDEFNIIMDRQMLFSNTIKKEGHMYDIIDSNVEV